MCVSSMKGEDDAHSADVWSFSLLIVSSVNTVDDVQQARGRSRSPVGLGPTHIYKLCLFPLSLICFVPTDEGHKGPVGSVTTRFSGEQDVALRRLCFSFVQTFFWGSSRSRTDTCQSSSAEFSFCFKVSTFLSKRRMEVETVVSCLGGDGDRPRPPSPAPPPCWGPINGSQLPLVELFSIFMCKNLTHEHVSFFDKWFSSLFIFRPRGTKRNGPSSVWRPTALPQHVAWSSW